MCLCMCICACVCDMYWSILHFIIMSNFNIENTVKDQMSPERDRNQ